MSVRGGRRGLLGAEFVALFILAPVVMAVAVPPDAMFSALGGLTLLALALLAVTPGASMRMLVQDRLRQQDLGPAVALLGATACVNLGVVVTTVPDQLFEPARSQPGLMILIVIFGHYCFALAATRSCGCAFGNAIPEPA